MFPLQFSSVEREDAPGSKGASCWQVVTLVVMKGPSQVGYPTDMANQSLLSGDLDFSSSSYCLVSL